MKKWISILLLAAMLLSLAGCASSPASAKEEPAPAETAEPAEAAGTVEQPAEVPDAETPAEETAAAPAAAAVTPPAAGETVEGFLLKEERDFPLVGAKVYLFEHERTGAQLMYIANSDTNRVFDLTFLTRAVDNTGLPHVFEHSTLDGSAKYPSKSLFFNLSYQTYNTYMNAMTSALYTTYPVGSLSEEQLLRYADYYTDSCLNPMIMEDEDIYREEAWRYRLADMDSPLTIEGTVYSEMKGAMDIVSTAYTDLLRAAYPGSTIGNVSGGEPESIPDMTWESLRSYHKEYYHPSNCVAYLYGQFADYTAFLKLLDEAFAPYEKREFTFEDAGYKPITESMESSQPFPVEGENEKTNGSVIFYAYVCPGLKDDLQEELVLNTLTDLLVVDASPLMQALKKALPSGSFASYIEVDGPEDMIVIYGQNLNPEDAAVMKETVDAVMADLGANGFTQELVDGVMASLSMSTRLVSEQSDVGVDLINSIAASYASTGDHFNYMDYVDALGRIAQWNEEGRYTKAINDWLLADGVNTVLSTTWPKAGLREELDAAEAERLAGVKAAMSKDELQAIIDRTNAPAQEDDASEYVAQLQAVTVSSLPEEIRRYDVSDRTGDDGVRYIDVAAGVDGVSRVVLLMDASGLPQDDILWFALYADLAGQMNTSGHTREELAVAATRYLNSREIRLSVAKADDADGFTPRLRAGWTATDEDLAEGYKLMYEILFETDYSDADTLLGLIQNTRSSLRSSITAEPYAAMIYRARGHFAPMYRYFSYFNGVDYYAFLEDVEAQMASDPAGVAARLTAVRDYFRNRTNAAAIYAGSGEGAAVNAPLSAAFMARLDAAPIENLTYDLPAAAGCEGLIVDSSVQYNGIVADYPTMGLDSYTGDMDALASLVSDMYLYPKLRDQYGAYGVMLYFVEDNGAYMISYRDPNVQETFDVYEALPEFLRTLEVDQETLDGYILSAYSNLAKPTGELSAAVEAALDTLVGDPTDAALGYMHALKGLTAESVKAYADVFGKMIASGVRFTAGGAAAVNANAALYENILNPFGSVDLSQVVLTDVPEGHEHYAAVRYVFEELVMAPKTEDTFGVDDEATMGDLAGSLYALLGGELDAQDEAMELFAGYGIVPASWKSSIALSGSNAQAFIANFSQAVGVDYTKDESASGDILTRGELAEILKVYVEYLETVQ